MRKRYSKEVRERVIAEVHSTGEPVRTVAERLGVCVSSAHRWIKKAVPGPSAPAFARLLPARAATRASLTVEVGRATIRVDAGFDAELLREVIAALVPTS